MIRFRNKVTGSVMYVHETRIDEYLAAGHTMDPPPLPVKSEKPVKQEAQEKPKRKK